jgi:hypothetical protein
MNYAGYDLAPLGQVARKFLAVYDELQPPGSDPLVDFDERDLLALAEGAGFFPIHLFYEAEIVSAPRRSWEGFLHSSGNPNVPTVTEAMERALDADEQESLISYLRPLVEDGGGTWRMAYAHLAGTKTSPPVRSVRSPLGG